MSACPRPIKAPSHHSRFGAAIAAAADACAPGGKASRTARPLLARCLHLTAAVAVGLCAVMLGAVTSESLASTPADPWMERMALFESQDRAEALTTGGLEVVGSSSITGWHDLDRGLAHLRPVRRGLDGATLSALTQRLDRLVLPHAPRLLVVYGGDNDLAAGATPEQVLADWRELVTQVHSRLPQTHIAFLSIKPSPQRAAMLARTHRANALVAADVGRDPRLSYIDVHTPMLDEQGRLRTDLYRDDGLHLNDAGYALWTTLLANRLNRSRLFEGGASLHAAEDR